MKISLAVCTLLLVGCATGGLPRDAFVQRDLTERIGGTSLSLSGWKTTAAFAVLGVAFIYLISDDDDDAPCALGDIACQILP